MKLTTLLLILPFFAQSQKIGAGASIGYGNQNKPLMELSIGVKAKNIIIYPVDIQVPFANNPTSAVIIEPRLAYKFGSWEPYIGEGYHMAGNENSKACQSYAGFKPGAGIKKYFGRFITSIGVSGNVYSLKFGVFGFR